MAGPKFKSPPVWVPGIPQAAMIVLIHTTDSAFLSPLDSNRKLACVVVPDGTTTIWIFLSRHRHNVLVSNQ